MKFTYIRNRIREYSLDSLLDNIIKFLRFSDIHNESSIPIWNLLLLMKWTFIYSGYKYPTKTATYSTINTFSRYIDDLAYQHQLIKPGSNYKIDKLISITSSQQSYFQINIRKDSFARQQQLFNLLKARNSTFDQFEKLTGFNIEEFLVMSFVLWGYINPSLMDSDLVYNGIIHNDFFDLLKKIYPTEKVLSFINFMTLDTKKAKSILLKDERIRNESLEPYVKSIFTKYPIILFNEKHIIFHRNILKYSLNFSIYDLLKESINEKFAEEFGKVFESYVELGLKEVKLNYKNESMLKKGLGSNSKLVDFVVNDNIYIECKAIEIKAYPSVYPDDEVIFNWLKSSVVKAYSEQLLTVANSINSNSEKFGIILTYKELNIGNARMAWDNFLKAPCKEYASKYNLDLNKLPPSNLFFIDLASWDKMILIIKKGQATLYEILKKAKEKEQKENNFYFSYVLNDYKLKGFDLDYINEGYKIYDIFDSFND